MTSVKVRAYCCVALCVFSSSSLAWAETDQPAAQSGRAVAGHSDAGDLVYEFEDDALNALGNEAHGMVLRVRPGAARVLLLRPRVQFVTELIQSVEAL